MPEYRVEEQHITTGLSRRHTASDPASTEALRRLATGMLRQVHAGLSDPISDAVKGQLGVDENDQMAQREVDWYLEGRRDNPPFPERAQFRPQIRSTLAERIGSVPSDEVVEVLVNTLVGIERDLLLAASPAGRMMIAGKLVSVYVDGA